jgi:dephospho-CoA kinase
MKVIGLTGGIGSGKSAVTVFLKELGAVIIDSDKVGHEVMEPGTRGYREIVAAFGKDILDPQGVIDRKKLGQIVFSSPEALQRLNRIMHRRIHQAVQAKLNEYRKQGAIAAVIEALVMVEGGWTSLVDETWLVIASRDVVIKRLRERGLSETEALVRISRQVPPEEKIDQADVVIDNNGDLAQLREKVEKLWRDRLSA